MTDGGKYEDSSNDKAENLCAECQRRKTLKNKSKVLVMGWQMAANFESLRALFEFIRALLGL
jgi:hypothetical protein